jgi:hypothetical protein
VYCLTQPTPGPSTPKAKSKSQMPKAKYQKPSGPSVKKKAAKTEDATQQQKANKQKKKHKPSKKHSKKKNKQKNSQVIVCNLKMKNEERHTHKTKSKSKQQAEKK